MSRRSNVTATNDGVRGFFSRAREQARKLDRGEAIAPEFVVRFQDADGGKGTKVRGELPTSVRYVKNGRGSRWWHSARTNDQVHRVGVRSP